MMTGRWRGVHFAFFDEKILIYIVRYLRPARTQLGYVTPYTYNEYHDEKQPLVNLCTGTIRWR